MQVQLRPDQEAFLLDQIRSGRFATMHEALHEAVSLLKKARAESTLAFRPSPGNFLQQSPLAGSGLMFERSEDGPRSLGKRALRRKRAASYKEYLTQAAAL